MKINFICNDVFTYGNIGWSPEDKFLAGTEEALVQWSKILQARGHEVKVYYNGKAGEWHGVSYRGREAYTPADACINIKCSEFTPREPTVYLTNETDAGTKDLSKFKAVILPSRWSVDNLNVKHEAIEILPYGYDSTAIKPGKKVPKQVLSCSSPDRGLSTLLTAWPEIVKYHPDATLIVTYGFANNSQYPIPNLFALGAVDDKTMAELYQSSDIWAHPCNGGELFGISGVKAQAAGCVPVFFPTMALAETVRHGIRSTPESFVRDMVSILGNTTRKEDIRKELASEKYPDWEDSTSLLEAIINKTLDKS